MSSAAAAANASLPGPTEIQLAIRGMTCAACAARVEKKLSAIEGVASRVNFATEKATVFAPLSVSAPQLIEAVEQAGYRAELAAPAAGHRAAGADAARVACYNIAAIPLAAAGYLNPFDRRGSDGGIVGFRRGE